MLCLLALRDWTAYELAVQVRRSLRYCWPKTDRLLYVVPKRLVAQGLARIRREPGPDGRRVRTAYAITPAGRPCQQPTLTPFPRDDTTPTRIPSRPRWRRSGGGRLARGWWGRLP